MAAKAIQTAGQRLARELFFVRAAVFMHFPQGLKPYSFNWLYRHDQSHALIQNPPEMSFSAACKAPLST
jgi:hypothetical protein